MLNRLSIASALVCCLAAWAGAAEWEKIALNGGATIEFPGTPKVTIQKTPFGLEMKTHIAFRDGSLYGLSFASLSADPGASGVDPDLSSKAMIAGALIPLDGKVSSEWAITVNGHPGRCATATGKVGPAEVAIKIQVVFTRDSMYMQFLVPA